MNWSVLTKKQQYMAIGTVVLAVAQIFILIHFLGGQDSSESNDASSQLELGNLQEQLEEAQLVLTKSKMINATLEETVAKLDELSVHTPTVSDRYAWAYEYVSIRAVKAGVELDSLEEIVYVGDDDEDPAGQPYELRLSTQCGYNQLVEFLWRIEQGNPLVRVKDVNITTFSGSPNHHNVKVLLQWPATLKIERGNG